MMAQTAYYPGLYHTGPSRSYNAHRVVRTDEPYSLYNGYSSTERFPQKVHVKPMTSFDDDVRSNTSSMSPGVSASQATPSFQLVRKASIRSAPRVQAPTDNPFRIDIYSMGVVMESRMTGRKFDTELFKVEAEAPSGRVIRMAGDGNYSAQFTPDEIGRWRVAMYYDNKFMDGCPIDVCDPSQVRVRELRGGHVGKQQVFHVDCTGAGQGDLGVDITHNGKRVSTNLTETSTPRLFKVAYTPYSPGPYEVNVHFNRAEVRDSDFHSTDPEERQRRAVFNTTVTKDGGVLKVTSSCDWEIDYVTGGPFIVHATDSSNIEVYGMKDGTVCSNPELIVDCTKVGEGDTTADVTHNGLRYPCKVRKDQPGMYRVSFKPRGPGVYKIWVNYDGVPIKGSPFVQEIAELGSPRAYGDGLTRGMPGRPQTFTVDPRGNPGHITADVIGPTENVPCQLTPQSDGTLLGNFVPRETGEHKVDVRLDGKPVENSPFKPYVVDPARVRVPGGWTPLVNEKGIIPLHVNKEKMLPFDASNAGLGELSAEVRGPRGRIPVAIDARNDGRHTVMFTPRTEGKHYIDVKWGGFPLVNSPYEGYATRDPEPLVFPENDVITMTKAPALQSTPPQPPVVEKDIIPLIVGQEKELPFDTADAGPGQLTAGVRGPNNKPVPAAVDDRVPGKPSVRFTPQEEGKHLIDVNWNDSPLSSSPFIGFASREPNNNIYQPPTAYPFVRKPSERMKDEDKDIIPLKVNKEKQIPFDTSKAGPGRLTATVRGPTHNVIPAVEDRGDGHPVVSFTPEEEGKHYIDVNWNGDPLPQSPLLGYATRDIEPNGLPNGAAPVFLANQFPSDGSPQDKPIIPLKVNQEKALPFDTTRAGPGKMTAAVQGPTRPIPVIVEDKKDGKPTVLFTPEEEGTHNIDVNWNNKPIAQSPLLGYAAPDDEPRYTGPPPVHLAGYNPDKGGRPYDPEKDIIPLKVNQPKQLPFDATEAGPGELTATVQGPNRRIPANVDDIKNGKPTLNFVPEEEGKHLIQANWNGDPIPNSPFVGYATRDPQPVLISPVSSRPPSVREDPDVSFRSSLASLAPYEPQKVRVLPTEAAPPSPAKVILSGKGLKEAEVDKPAVFNVDGTQASPGKPTAHLEGVKTDIPVHVEPTRPQNSRCTYVPKVPGAYKLHVKWNDQPLRGSPFKVNVRAPPKQEPKGMVYMPSYDKPRRPGEDVTFTIDHPDPSKLTVTCTDPRGQVIPCRFLDNLDGTRSLKMMPTMPGRHRVDIKHNQEHIMGSPYHIDISESQVTGRVRVWGPGIASKGILNNFESNFFVDTTGAGAGELRVRIMGPKGAFKVKMRKVPQIDKRFQCFYTPVEAGIYTVYVQWTGAHVDGSPFTVVLAHNSQDLDSMTDYDRRSSVLRHPSSMANGSPDNLTEDHGFLY